jgi:hypothetical protein
MHFYAQLLISLIFMAPPVFDRCACQRRFKAGCAPEGGLKIRLVGGGEGHQGHDDANLRRCRSRARVARGGVL